MIVTGILPWYLDHKRCARLEGGMQRVNVIWCLAHFGSNYGCHVLFGHYNQFGLFASQNIKEKSCYDDNVIVVKSRDSKTLGYVDHLTAKALVQIMNVYESLKFTWLVRRLSLSVHWTKNWRSMRRLSQGLSDWAEQTELWLSQPSTLMLITTKLIMNINLVSALWTELYGILTATLMMIASSVILWCLDSTSLWSLIHWFHGDHGRKRNR